MRRPLAPATRRPHSRTRARPSPLTFSLAAMLLMLVIAGLAPAAKMELTSPRAGEAGPLRAQLFAQCRVAAEAGRVNPEEVVFTGTRAYTQDGHWVVEGTSGSNSQPGEALDAWRCLVSTSGGKTRLMTGSTWRLGDAPPGLSTAAAPQGPM